MTPVANTQQTPYMMEHVASLAALVALAAAGYSSLGPCSMFAKCSKSASRETNR